MKLTNQEIINTFNGLDSIAEKEMPILLTYKIVNNMDVLLKSYNIFEQAKQKAKNDKDLKELLDLEVELDLELLDKNELVDAGIKLSPIQLVQIKRLING